MGRQGVAAARATPIHHALVRLAQFGLQLPVRRLQIDKADRHFFLRTAFWNSW
jgi:hypothetical protein